MMLQNLHIIREDGAQDGSSLIKVLTDVTREIVYTSNSTSDALQWSNDILTGEGGSITLNRGRYELHQTVHLGDNVLLRGGNVNERKTNST